MLPKAPPEKQQTSHKVEFTLKLPGVWTEESFPARIPLGNIKNGAGQPTITVFQINQGFLLDCNNGHKRVAFVLAPDGSWIDCYPQADTLPEDIETWLFGLVLAFLLQGRGIFSLHAAAVDCHGQGVAFMGNNRFGKSTLALSFLQQGHSLITDDVLPIVEKGGVPFAQPVYPAMNLWPKTLAHFVKQNGNLTKEEIKISKHRYSVETLKVPFCKSEVPLGRIYFLNALSKEEIDKVRVIPVPQATALLELLGYTRASSMIELTKQKKLLKTYANVVSKVPVRYLEYPGGFEFLPAVYEAVLEDIVRSVVTEKI